MGIVYSVYSTGEVYDLLPRHIMGTKLIEMLASSLWLVAVIFFFTPKLAIFRALHHRPPPPLHIHINSSIP